MLKPSLRYCFNYSDNSVRFDNVAILSCQNTACCVLHVYLSPILECRKSQQKSHHDYRKKISFWQCLWRQKTPSYTAFVKEKNARDKNLIPGKRGGGRKNLRS